MTGKETKPRRKNILPLHGNKIGAERVRNKPHEPFPDKYIDVCLNCTAPKCRGDCSKLHPEGWNRRKRKK